MGIRDWLTGRRQDEDQIMEEQSMETPARTWAATEPDELTRRHEASWGTAPDDGPADEEIADYLEQHPEIPDPGRTEASHAAGEADREADPIVDSGSRMYRAPNPTHHDGERCEHCGARVPDDHDLLTEVFNWLAPSGNEAMHRFYVHLFELAPYLRELFPKEIEEQEEKLLAGIQAVLLLFNAGEDEMEQLNSELARLGRSHTRFDPPATWEEYGVVKRVLFDILGDMLGDKLTPRHIAVLVRAYEYTAGMMIASQATAKLKGVGRRRRTV